MIHDARKGGLSLIELLISVALLMILSALLFPFFGNFRRAKELDETAREVVFLLRRAQALAENNASSTEWGVHFENPTSSPPFYSLISITTPTTTEEIHYLPQSLDFTDPADGAGRNIVFTKGGGKNKIGVDETMVLTDKAGNQKKGVVITKEGRIELGRFQTIQEGPTTTVPDNSLNKVSPTTNYSGAVAYLARGNGSDVMRQVVTFDTKTYIPAGSTVTSATLKLYVYGYAESPAPGTTSPFSQPILACKLTRPLWNETASNWNVWNTGQSWTTVGGDYVTSSPSCGTGTTPTVINNWFAINITSLVQDAVTNNINTHLLVRFQTETITDSNEYLYSWASEYATNVTLRPKLEIIY